MPTISPCIASRRYSLARASIWTVPRSRLGGLGQQPAGSAGRSDPPARAGSSKIHADDTPVPVLAPGMGKTKTARLWTYVRDDRPAGQDIPSAVWFAYTEDRKGEHPRRHLSKFTGILQADGYAGFHHLYEGARIVEAACWAHVRRKFYDIHVANGSATAADAIERIGLLYDIEREIRGKPADLRYEVRQARARPLVDELHRWLNKTLAGLSRKSDTAAAIRYALSRWSALTRYLDDGQIEMDNSAAERALRTVALGRKNYLFAGSDAGGERAAAIYSLLGTAKLNGLDPELLSPPHLGADRRPSDQPHSGLAALESSRSSGRSHFISSVHLRRNVDT